MQFLNLNLLYSSTHICRRKASADNYRRAAKAKLQAEAECKDAIEELKRAKRANSLQKSRYANKQESIQELKKMLGNKDSLVKTLQKNLATLESRCRASAAEVCRVEKQNTKAQTESKALHKQLTRVVQKMRRYESTPPHYHTTMPPRSHLILHAKSGSRQNKTACRIWKDRSMLKDHLDRVFKTSQGTSWPSVSGWSKKSKTKRSMPS